MPGLILTLLVILLAARFVSGQPPDPASAALNRAYDALRSRDYAAAIQEFRQALTIQPNRIDTHKDLGYTLLKIGETEAGRDESAAAARLDPTG